METKSHWLLQPYPFDGRWLAGLRNGFWAGAFVVLFLFFFRPFGADITPGKEWEFLLVCGAFGLVTLFITVLVNGFCLLLPGIFKEENWVVWKEILFNLFFIGCVGVGNMLLAKALWNASITSDTFWRWQLYTFAIGIFPTTFGAFLSQLRLNRRYTAEAAAIHPSGEHTHPEMLVTLSGDNQNETLRLSGGQLLFLAAQDNYVQVFFFENGVLKQRMLRGTLRKMEEALAPWPQFFRCHRTFLVNLDRVEQVSGNAQGYRLHFAGTEENVPVSRNLNAELRVRLGEI